MTPIPVEKLHAVWEWVEKGLYAVRAKTHQPWLPADVYVQLRLKTAHLVVIEDAGFLIYQIMPGDDFRGVLHVWCLHGELKPFTDQALEWLDAHAKALGVRCIRIAGRKGWGRGGHFKQVGYLFEREV